EDLVREFVARYGHDDGARLAFIENYPPHDAQLWLRLRDRYPACVWVPFADLWRAGLKGRPGQRWLTTRFHAHLLAAATGASGVAVDIQPDYYGVKHASLTEIGIGWTVVWLDSDEPLPAFTSNPEFPRRARELARRKRQSPIGCTPIACCCARGDCAASRAGSPATCATAWSGSFALR